MVPVVVVVTAGMAAAVVARLRLRTVVVPVVAVAPTWSQARLKTTRKDQLVQVQVKATLTIRQVPVMAVQGVRRVEVTENRRHDDSHHDCQRHLLQAL